MGAVAVEVEECYLERRWTSVEKRADIEEVKVGVKTVGEEEMEVKVGGGKPGEMKVEGGRENAEVEV